MATYPLHTDNIQLVVLRQVGGARPDVLEFVSSVVKEAARDRKTVRVSVNTVIYIIQTE